MRFAPTCIVLLLTALTVTGCTDVAPPAQPPSSGLAPAGETPKWQVVAESELGDSQIAQRDRALAARDLLTARLKSRLMEVVSNDGLAAAISVCKEDAPRLAREISQEKGLSIGRTSFRLRNSANQPPGWAEELVKDKVAEVTYLESENHLAALLPIPTGAVCLNCHGTKSGIPSEVLAALEDKYPDDQATGFEEGELRGWFWVEVAGP